jgi:hypothetical protein
MMDAVEEVGASVIVRPHGVGQARPMPSKSRPRSRTTRRQAVATIFTCNVRRSPQADCGCATRVASAGAPQLREAVVVEDDFLVKVGEVRHQFPIGLSGYRANWQSMPNPSIYRSIDLIDDQKNRASASPSDIRSFTSHRLHTISTERRDPQMRCPIP